MKANLIKRIERAEVDLAPEVAPGQLPQFLEQERRGDDRRARIEREPVLVEDVGATARTIEALEHGDAITARAQAHRGGKSAEAAADDDRMRPRAPRRCVESWP